MIKMFLKLKSGFTLVELVMVLVIVGLLASIIIPRFSTQRDQAKIAVTKANLESLRTVISLYYAQEGNWPGNNLGDLWAGSASSGRIYLPRMPSDGFMNANDVQTGTGSGCGSPGGWCWDSAAGGIFVDLPDNNPNYANEIFSAY